MRSVTPGMLRRNSDGHIGLIVAVVAYALTAVLTLGFLVPINNRAAHWTSDNRPADWREQLPRRDRGHALRVGLLLAGFIALLVAGT